MRIILFLFLVFIVQQSSDCVAYYPSNGSSQKTRKTATVTDKAKNTELIELKNHTILLENKLVSLEKKINTTFELCIIIATAILIIAAYLLGYKRDMINSLNKNFELLHDELFITLDDTHKVRNNLYEFMNKYGKDEVYKAVKSILHEISCNNMERAKNLLSLLPDYFTLAENHKKTLRYTIEFFIDNNVFFIQLKKRERGNEFYNIYLNTIQELVQKLSELENE